MFVIYSNKDFQSFPPLLPQFVAFPGLSLLFPQAKIVSSYPIKINLIGCKWQSLVQAKIKFHDSLKQPPHTPSLFFSSFFLLVRFAAHLCSGASGCLRLRGCVLALFSSYECASTPPLFTSSLPLPLSLSLSLSRSRWRMGVGGSVGTQKALCLGFFHMVSFKLAYWTNTLCHNIFSYSTQGCWGTSGPPLCSLPTSLFHSWPISKPCTPGQEKKSKERVKSMQEKCQAGFSSKLQEFLDALLTCLQILKVKGTDFCLRYANIKTPQSFLPQTSRFLTIVTLHSCLMYSTRHLAFSSGMLILRLWTCTPYRQRFTYSKDPSSTIKCQ